MSLLTPPPTPPHLFQFASDVKVWSATWKISDLFNVQYSFVKYSVYIIFRVIIHVSPKKKLAVVCAKQVGYTIVYIMYNLWSAARFVIPTVCIWLWKYTQDITKKNHYGANIGVSINHIIYCMIWDKVLRLIVD